MEIQVEHITRVEGHGNILASLQDGQIERALFEVVEANRFFEAVVVGRDWEEVCHIAPRICGICALSHSCVSLRATEAALGIEVSEQTKLLRRLIMDAEVMSSHALHAYFLAAPDFLGLPSVMPLIRDDPEVVRRAFRIKKAGYELGEVVVARHTHPVGSVPGGFTQAPSVTALEKMRGRLVDLREDAAATVELYRKLKVPQFERPTTYVSLRRPDYYALYDGEIASSSGDSVAGDRYEDALREYVVSHSTAKHAQWRGETYMVGALARVNNNWRQLRPEAQEAMGALGLNPACHNPFMNTVAQVVELVHCLEDSIALIDEIGERGLSEEEVEIEPRAGRGVGVVEAPRGLLIHDYWYDEQGRCTKAKCVIPTGQNLANLDADMQGYLAEITDRSEDEIRLRLEMLVRAYDPCISCSAH
ncbi:MAG: Ni/Fe hydrogenase subunit alpha [Armatimonadota bacterium]|nr:MAG: Ni/Fe hydrogenase subunit alpha [Armatimonadota bacterium]